ncbi:MAG: iron-sulfur cluster assembly protein [Pseudomonadota bacterium]|nr:iron-sulfur cluster assembly protein [Pseudomonadota bacterium]
MQDNEIDSTEASLLEALALQDKESLKDYIAYSGQEKPAGEKTAAKEDIIEALKTVSDPEIMINVYDMGLIYNIDLRKNGDVYIEMTLTAPTCPVAGILPQQVADAVAMVEGTGRVEVKVVWEPAWSLDMISDDVRMMMDML